MTYLPNDDFSDDYDLDDRDIPRARRRDTRRASRDGASPKRTRAQRPPRTERDQAFKCGHCKQFIGAPISGGRHRNHCPNCLYSKHVDASHPGDRKSECGSLMAPVGIISRRNGEQAILHRCLGCGKETPNRIAADDHPVLLLHLPPVALPGEPAVTPLPADVPIALPIADEREDDVSA